MSTARAEAFNLTLIVGGVGSVPFIVAMALTVWLRELRRRSASGAVPA